ncbi:MAG: HDOD domain-containing protein [Planctomycetes bacterium]|nr:HDOD domain-containing protein [Planctomycetota bacterium]
MTNSRASGTVPDAAPAPHPELVLTHLNSLPTLAPVAVKLLQVTCDDSSNAKDVVEVLRADQSLTAKILSMANSAGSGVRAPIGTLDKAVVLLGFSAIRSIVLSVKVFDCFASSRPATAKLEPNHQAFDRSEFWKHALAVACGARRLAAARRELGVEPELAFVAGLLHDLGKVALDAVFPKAYERIATQADHTRGDIADEERAVLGVDHTIAGRRLTERWNLPAYLQEVVWLHHLAAEALPSSVRAPRLISLVQIADVLAREQRIGYSGNYVFYEHSAQMAKRLEFSAKDLEDMLRSLMTDVAEQAELLGLDHATPDSLYLKALTEANAELGRLNSDLVASNRGLAAGARFFRSITRFDRKLGASAELPEVVAAMTEAAAVALQRQCLATFGLRENDAAVDMCWVSGRPGEGGSRTMRPSPELVAWLRDPGDCLDALLTRLPQPLRPVFEPAANNLGSGDAWLLPIVRDGRISGGIVFSSEADERARISSEADDLRSFMASLGLALSRANAQATARRLSDDLADTNRRLQQMQLELLRSRTLSMIAEMSAGAAHELNSPLTVISGRAQMLQQRIEDPEMQRSLQLIHDKAHECSRIVTELMDFARPRPPRLEAVDLAALLARVRAEWLERSGLPEERFMLEPLDAGEARPLPAVHGDRDQLKTVFHELVANAEDAVAETDGSMTVTCRLGLANDSIEVLVQDTGCGMEPAVLQRAFDPFFSHRAAGRGRGLGLPRAHRIVEAHGGRIWFESQPGEGTVAHVILRPAPGTAEAGRPGS